MYSTTTWLAFQPASTSNWPIVFGDATLSRLGRDYMLTNARPNRLRDMANLEPQKRFRGPKSVRLDDQGRMYVPDYGAYRVQIYQKEAVALGPDQMIPPPRSPSLQTT